MQRGSTHHVFCWHASLAGWLAVQGRVQDGMAGWLLSTLESCWAAMSAPTHCCQRCCMLPLLCCPAGSARRRRRRSGTRSTSTRSGSTAVGCGCGCGGLRLVPALDCAPCSLAVPDTPLSHISTALQIAAAAAAAPAAAAVAAVAAAAATASPAASGTSGARRTSTATASEGAKEAPVFIGHVTIVTAAAVVQTGSQQRCPTQRNFRARRLCTVQEGR